MALIAVLWIVAALSIMVTGLVYTVRQQIQIAATQRDQVSGQAAGEAALALALQDIMANGTRITAISSTTVPYGGVEVAVEIAPLNGWISLNGAGAPLLADLLRIAGGLDQARAEALAKDIVEWRSSRPDIDPTTAGAAAMLPRRFEAPEDLLLVPGIDYPLYARIAPLVSADLFGNAQVNPQAAPPEVLAVLAQGNMGRVAQYVAQRNAGDPGDASGFVNASAAGGGSGAYRLRAKVPLDAGKILLLTRDVALGGGYSRGVPWRVLRTDRQIIGANAG